MLGVALIAGTLGYFDDLPLSARCHDDDWDDFLRVHHLAALVVAPLGCCRHGKPGFRCLWSGDRIADNCNVDAVLTGIPKGRTQGCSVRSLRNDASDGQTHMFFH